MCFSSGFKASRGGWSRTPSSKDKQDSVQGLVGSTTLCRNQVVGLELAGGGMLEPLWTPVIGAENPGKVSFLRNSETRPGDRKINRLQGAEETRQIEPPGL